jgi:hypothetical protein
MADEVFYSEGKLVSGRGPGIPRTALAGGDELVFAEITGNFASTSVSFIDVTGLTTGAITVPEGPFIVEAEIPLFNNTSGADSSVQIVNGSTVLVADTFRAPGANTGDLLQLKARIPYSIHTPAPGSTQTYKVQIASSTTVSLTTVFVDFAGRVNPAFIRAYRT